jgi:hypothetical protein
LEQRPIEDGRNHEWPSAWRTFRPSAAMLTNERHGTTGTTLRTATGRREFGCCGARQLAHGPRRLPAAGSRRHVPASRAIEGTQNEETDHCDGYWRRTCRRRNRSRGTGKRRWALWRRGRVGQRRGPLRLRPTPGWQLHPLRHCVRARFRRHELLSGVPATTGRHSAGSVRIGIARVRQPSYSYSHSLSRACVRRRGTL